MRLDIKVIALACLTWMVGRKQADDRHGALQFINLPSSQSRLIAIIVFCFVFSSIQGQKLDPRWGQDWIYWVYPLKAKQTYSTLIINGVYPREVADGIRHDQEFVLEFDSMGNTISFEFQDSSKGNGGTNNVIQQSVLSKYIFRSRTLW